jgi:hypothetical protein
MGLQTLYSTRIYNMARASPAIMLQVQWCLIVSNADADAQLIRASMLVNAPASQLLTCHLSFFFERFCHLSLAEAVMPRVKYKRTPVLRS